MPKETKIQNEHPEIFLHIFQRKNELFKSDHQKYGRGGYLQGQHINVSIPASHYDKITLKK